MKKICFNASHLAGPTTGIERYTYEILTRVGVQLGDKYEIEALSLGDDKLISTTCFEGIKTISMPSLSALFSYVRRSDCLYINLSGPFSPKRKALVTLFDIRPIESKNYDPWVFRRKMSLLARTAKVNKNHLVTTSEYSRTAIKHFLHLNEEEITVIGCGWEHVSNVEREEIRKKWPNFTGEQFVLALGSQAPHKNIKWIYEVAKRNRDTHFVVVGKPWDSCPSLVSTDNVIVTGHLSDGMVRSLMESCSLFIQPSLYEGFGIPPLEALAYGAKIAVSSATCLPEIYREAAAIFDPLNYNYDIKELILEAAKKNPVAVLKKNTWDNAVKNWCQLIRKEMER